MPAIRMVLNKVNIKKISDRLIAVNGKLVREDHNGYWIANHELSSLEQNVFDNYIENLHESKCYNKQLN